MRSALVRPIVTVAIAVAIGGCQTQKGPAQAAIAAADSTLQTVATEAQAYVPDQFTAAGAQVAAARADFDAGKYADALTKAQEAATQVSGLGEAVNAKKAELTTAWQAMSDSLPGMVQSVQARVDELGKMRRLPAGMTKATLDSARADLAAMSGSWTQAMQAHDAGNLMQAATLGANVTDQVAKVRAALGMK